MKSLVNSAACHQGRCAVSLIAASFQKCALAVGSWCHPPLFATMLHNTAPGSTMPVAWSRVRWLRQEENAHA